MKYHNKTVIIDGKKLASRKEANRYQQLKLLQMANQIKDLQTQVSFELQPTFKKNNTTYRSIKYIADFVYYDINQCKYIIEDTKGFRTEVYKLKKKMFEYKYPDLTIIEI